MVAAQPVTQRQFQQRERMMAFFGVALLAFSGVLVALFLRYSLPIQQRLVLGAAADFPVSDRPYAYPAGQLVADLWLVHQTDGWYALGPTVQHPFVRCKVYWVADNHRFEDPCLGVKFALNGAYLEGPTGRHLLRYPVGVNEVGLLLVDLERPLLETETAYIERCMAGLRNQRAPLYSLDWRPARNLDDYCARLWKRSWQAEQ